MLRGYLLMSTNTLDWLIFHNHYKEGPGPADTHEKAQLNPDYDLSAESCPTNIINTVCS